MAEPDGARRVQADQVSGLETSGPKTSSVGVHGISETVKYAREAMGPVRGVRTLLALNQVDGFDCPSCAWADPPPGERKRAEFCENGAKAVAWEATRKRPAQAALVEIRAKPRNQRPQRAQHDAERRRR